MKNLKNLGKTLNKNEQEQVNGGSHQGSNYVCIENFPFTYNVNAGELCNDGGVPLCV